MTFTVLMENTAENGFLKEHGLSYHIQTGETSLLLDAGSSGKWLKNANKSGISVKDVDFAVLSHGHYDHSDGFRRFFGENEHAPLYLRKEALEGGLFSFSSGSPKFVGMHKDIEGGFSSRLISISEEISPLLPDSSYLVAHPRRKILETSLPKEGEGVYMRKIGWDQFVPDDFSHQQSLVVLENHHLYLFNSCFHGDILQIVGHVLSHFPNYPQFTLFGGLHLPVDKEGNPRFSTEYVTNLGNSLQEMGLSSLYTGHCTSSLAYSILKDRLHDDLHSLASGMVIEF